MSASFWLSETRWAAIVPHLPTNQPGARRVDDRRVISGIVHVLKVGCRWCDCPAEYGPSTTIYNRFNRWSRRRFWDPLLEALAACDAVFFTPRLRVKSYDELNGLLLDRCVAYAKAHPHPEQTDRTVWEMFEAEPPHLVRHVGRFDGFYTLPASVSKTCLVRFDNNKYSVSASAVGRPVEIQAYADRVVIRQGGRIVAEHPRAFGRGATSPSSLASPTRCATQGECVAFVRGAPFKDWVLPQAIDRIRRKLAGSDDGDRQMAKILAMVLSDGLLAVESACAEALIEGVWSADVIINIVSRQRDPAPPITIMTPAGGRDIPQQGPMSAWRMAVAGLRGELRKIAPDTTAYAEILRDLITIQIVGQTGFRRRTTLALDWRKDRLGHLRKQGGVWRLKVSRFLFKEPASSFFIDGYDSQRKAIYRDYDGTLADVDGFYDELDLFLERYRDLLRGEIATDALLLGSRNASEARLTPAALDQMSRRIWNRHLIWNPLRGSGFEGVITTVGWHAWRHIVATAVLKRSRDYLLAADAIQDSVDVCRQTYTRYVSYDRREDLGSVLRACLFDTVV